MKLVLRGVGAVYDLIPRWGPLLSHIVGYHTLGDFEESTQEPAVRRAISLQWHLLIFPQSLHVNQHHPLQLHRQPPQAELSRLQV